MVKKQSKKQETPHSSAASSGQELIVAGIGASAGGLEAFEQFFTHLPAAVDLPIAFVLVQHLAPDRKSILADLVKRYTRLQVYEVEDGMEVKPAQAYVIPPNKDMALLHGRLHLLEPEVPRGLRLPIDYFFRSLAQDQRERAVCIILAGAGADGTLGLKAIKELGGMAMAQDPASARHDGMPRSAIATGLVDYILPPDKMAVQLLAYVEHARGNRAARAGPLLPRTAELLQKIFILLQSQTGHDFSFYKQNTIHRRIERRMAVNQVKRLDHYVRFLQQNPPEVNTLFKELLIGVTHFFRDPEAFETLRTQVIGELIKKKSPGAGVRVWAPGCSSGEEAFSMAMLFQEYLDELKTGVKIQIFATDIDAEAIGQARTGLYPLSIAADVSPERLARFFTQTDHNAYHIKKIIREAVIFAEQNVAKDPPFSKLDLISCRNLLIYMEPELQQKVVSLFHYALNPEGFLFLGTSETIGELTHLFAPVDKKWKLYQRKAAGSPRVVIADFSTPARRKGVTHYPAAREAGFKIREQTEQILLEDYTPACAIINEKGEILYIHGRTGKYLEPASGEASLNILRMAREGLRLDLTAAIRQAVIHQEIVRYEGLQVKGNERPCPVNLTVRPVSQPAGGPGLLLVLFEDVTPAGGPPPPLAREVVTDKDRQLAELQREVKAKEEQLRTALEEMETAGEELTSGNEELQSTNEELQSTNEELETSKEELQSINEELLTVNVELHIKVEELARANNDMNNLLAGTGIGTVFVDHHLRIQQFTPAATRVINLIQGDVGRPVDHLVSNLVNYSSLVQDTRQVLNTLLPRETEVQTQQGEWYLLRILPYRTLENVVEGAVITFVDITELKQMRRYQQAYELAHSILDTVRDPLLVLDSQLQVVLASRAFCRNFHVSVDETVGQRVYDLGNKQWDIPELRRLLEEILPQQSSFDDYEVTHHFETLGTRTMCLNAREVYQQAGRERLILLVIEDITDPNPPQE